MKSLQLNQNDLHFPNQVKYAQYASSYGIYGKRCIRFDHDDASHEYWRVVNGTRYQSRSDYYYF